MYAAKTAPKPALRPQAADKNPLVEDIDLRLKHLAGRVTCAGFSIKKVAMRENLWKIARGKGYTVHSILGCNPQMITYDVAVNQRLLLPSKAGTLHMIQQGDTWTAIAKRYDIDANEIIKYNGNVKKLVPGEFVFIPGRMPDMDLMNDALRAKYELRALFVSPLGGRLSSTFGNRMHPITGKPSFHGGIDIAVHEGTWVCAAADGVVTFAGDNGGHYGKAVFILNQNGYETQYGHLSKILVHYGQRVSAHKLIAKSGSTGRSTGPHLHFTIKRYGVCVDPLKFLW
jgi:murein DD-endopeptidase MepM/ murein hydrolase activator NlpD